MSEKENRTKARKNRDFLCKNNNGRCGAFSINVQISEAFTR
jgi:hypothetical protein